jgi:hypothetical protein
MIIQNPNTVENGVDLTQANIPDTYSDFYALIRPILKKFYQDIISLRDFQFKTHNGNYEVYRFIHYFCEFYLGTLESVDIMWGYRSDEVIEGLYERVIDKVKHSNMNQVVTQFREALKLAAKDFVYGIHENIDPAFIQAVMAEISTFEIIENSSAESEVESGGAEQ